MRSFAWNAILAVVWAAFWGDFSPASLLVGFLVGYAAIALADRGPLPGRYGRTVYRSVAFALFYLWELTVSSLDVARHVLRPRLAVRPAILEVPLDESLSDLQITVLAILITMTPGTMSLDVSDDRRVLYVHVLHTDDPARDIRHIKTGFERRVREVRA